MDGDENKIEPDMESTEEAKEKVKCLNCCLFAC